MDYVSVVLAIKECDSLQVMRIKRPAIQNFVGHISLEENGCWNWIGADNCKYGIFTIDGKNVLAHRWAYEFHKGPIPKGLEIDHLCRNKFCVNPEHLEAVTAKENVRRAEKHRIRKKLTHCRKGHELTPDNISMSGKWRTCKLCRMETFNRYYRKLEMREEA